MSTPARELGHGIVAEFGDVEAMRFAVERLRAQGYQHVDTLDRKSVV